MNNNHHSRGYSPHGDEDDDPAFGYNEHQRGRPKFGNGGRGKHQRERCFSQDVNDHFEVDYELASYGDGEASFIHE